MHLVLLVSACTSCTDSLFLNLLLFVTFGVLSESTANHGYQGWILEIKKKRKRMGGGGGGLLPNFRPHLLGIWNLDNNSGGACTL